MTLDELPISRQLILRQARSRVLQLFFPVSDSGDLVDHISLDGTTIKPCPECKDIVEQLMAEGWLELSPSNKPVTQDMKSFQHFDVIIGHKKTSEIDRELGKPD